MRKALFILGDLSDSDIDWLAATGRKEAFTEGSILIREGEASANVYILLDGRLSVRIMASGAEEINVMHPGEFIGELSFLDSRPPSATVVAAVRSIVAAISRETLRGKLERDTAFAARFYRALGIFLAHRLRRLTTKTMATDGLDSSASRSGDEDEIDPELLDSVSLAANRFEWLKSRFGSE